MIDFHTHIIPGIDDGSHNVEESVQMLKMSYAQGIDTVVLTSHFRLGEHKIKSWLKQRTENLEKVFDSMTEVERRHIPKMVLASEIEYTAGMNRWDYLDELVIKGTEFIMTEMPFMPWTEQVIKTIDDIALNSPFTPIIPHIDRYMHTFTKMEYIEHFYDMPVIIQMNAIYINGVANVQFFKPMLDSGVVDILGSDCHGKEWRPQNLGSAIEVVRKVCGQDVLDRIDKKGREILKNAKYIEF